MICPECGSEYREGHLRCGSCEVDLVPLPPPAPPSPAPEPRRYFPSQREVELVKVYETGNPALRPLFESFLAEAGIDFLTRNETAHHMFGSYGTGYDDPINAVEYWVRVEDAAEARALAEAVESSEIAPELPPDGAT